MKVLVVTIDAGGGHNAAAKAIKEYLLPYYEIKIVSLIKEIFWPLDPVYYASLGCYSLDDCYNFFVQRKRSSMINFFSNLAVFLYPIVEFFMYHLLLRYIKKHKPGLIISVVPILNNVIGRVAQTLNQPFIVVPTDLDVRWFTKNLHARNFKNFVFTVPFDDPMIWNNVKDSTLEKSQIEVVGFPVKKNFFEPKDIDALKMKYRIHHEKKVLMIMMGGMGSSAILTYIKELLKLQISVHLLICIGSNKDIGKDIKTLIFPEHISFTIVEFTESIADLMAVSDLLLTKSGSVTVCEALYMKLPMLLDGIGPVLEWEQLNHDFVKKHDFGQMINMLEELRPKVYAYLSDEKRITTIQQKMKDYPKLHFQKYIVRIVQDFC